MNARVLAAWLVLVPLALARQREIERETHPDGTPRIERSVVRENGAAVLDGPYKRFHPNGVPAVAGAFERGLASGDWVTSYDDGKPRTKGAFHKGARYGKWEMFWPGEKLAATGSYSLGLRDQRWIHYDSSGAKDESESGSYRAAFERYKDSKQEIWLAELRGDERHGRFTSYWRHGVRQLDGRYAHGQRAGWWTFRHADGTIEAELLTGAYSQGARGAAKPEEMPPDPFAIPDAEPAEIVLPLDALPIVEAVAGLPPSRRNELRAAVEAVLANPGIEAVPALVASGREAVPHVLNALIKLDLASPEGAERAARLVDEVLSAVAGYRGWRWSRSGDGKDAERNRLAVLRWYAWGTFAKDDAGYWAWLAGAPPDAELLTLELVDHLHGAATVEEPEAPADGGQEGATFRWTKSPLFTARARVQLDRDAQVAMRAGLTWLVAHQATDGCWYPGRFLASCGELGSGVCDGLGDSRNLVGITGLGLLALLGSGDDPATGPYADRVVLAAERLLDGQDPSSGRFGEEASESFLYDHAIATLALAELAQASPTPKLQDALARAVAYTISAQNPGLGWRYDAEPEGDNDTSVTAWCAVSLAAARDAGVEVPKAALEGALQWFERVTDPESGRVGYTLPGSPSARISKLNDHFLADIGEPLTAAALYARCRIAPPVQDDAAPGRQAALLLAKPPVWDGPGAKTDQYSWFWTSQALAAYSGTLSERWQEQLRAVALPAQRKLATSDLVGSWDPIDPWGPIGGRIYSTAMVVLALEAPIRAAKPRR